MTRRTPAAGQEEGFGASPVTRDEDAGALLLGAVVPGGGYTTTEPESGQPAGYDFAGASCTAAAVVDGRKVTLAPASGQDVTCTYLNDKRTTMRVVKRVLNDDGGTAQPGDLTMHVGGQSFPGASGDGTTVAIAPGPVEVTETPGDFEGQHTASFGEGCTTTRTCCRRTGRCEGCSSTKLSAASPTTAACTCVRVDDLSDPPPNC